MNRKEILPNPFFVDETSNLIDWPKIKKKFYDLNPPKEKQWLKEYIQNDIDGHEYTDEYAIDYHARRAGKSMIGHMHDEMRKLQLELDCINTQMEKEARIRAMHPGAQEAWEKYHLMIQLCNDGKK